MSAVMKPLVHTPTPWITSHLDPHVVLRLNHDTLRSEYIASCSDGDSANAAHIVKCVNAHDELVAALKRAESELTLASHRNRSMSMKITLGTVREALAKVQP